MTAAAKSAAQLNLAKIREVQVQRSKPCFLVAENCPYHLCLSPRQISLSQSVLPFVPDRLLEAFMATCKQLATVLNSARGWTAVPMTSTGCYDTNHLFYPFHGVYTDHSGNVLINPRATPSGVLTHSLVYSVYIPGKHRITIAYHPLC